jgi:hypothetical protein
MANPYASLPCPLPECGEDLYLDWQYQIPLFVGDTEGAVPVIDNAYTGAWEVTCAAGHTILIPGGTGCPCEDQQGDGCPHQGDAANAYDWSEELRTFRPSDMQRLVALIKQLDGAS